jgi:aspartate aminotransferase
VLERLGSMPGVSCGEPMGAFYAFPNVSGLFNERIGTSFDMASHIIESVHVVTVAGAAFGRDGYLRLSFAVEIERLREALDRLADAFLALA